MIDNWDDENKQPLVAIAIEAIEGETKYIKAYDSNGKAYLLDADKEPDVPFIIIRNNERMDMVEELSKSPSPDNAKTSGKMQTIPYLRCPNLNDIESWYFVGLKYVLAV